jgi:hypothetical protein
MSPRLGWLAVRVGKELAHTTVGVGSENPIGESAHDAEHESYQNDAVNNADSHGLHADGCPYPFVRVTIVYDDNFPVFEPHYLIA